MPLKRLHLLREAECWAAMPTFDHFVDRQWATVTESFASNGDVQAIVSPTAAHRPPISGCDAPNTNTSRYCRLVILSSCDPGLQRRSNRESLETRTGTCIRAGTAAGSAEEVARTQRSIRTSKLARTARKPAREVVRRSRRSVLNPYQRSVPNLLHLEQRWCRRC